MFGGEYDKKVSGDKETLSFNSKTLTLNRFPLKENDSLRSK